MLSGRAMDAKEALQVGLVNRVVEPDELMPAAIEYAALIASHDMLPLRLTKRALNSSASASFADALSA
jgi:enoyl-CoA hydratase